MAKDRSTAYRVAADGGDDRLADPGNVLPIF